MRAAVKSLVRQSAGRTPGTATPSIEHVHGEVLPAEHAPGAWRMPRDTDVQAAGKDVAIPPGVDAGWTTLQDAVGLGGQGYRAGPARVKELLKTYGGTDQSVVWVFACASRIAEEQSGYEWGIYTDDPQDPVPVDGPDPMLMDLLRVPQKTPPRMTWADFVFYLQLDLELAGNSYWLKDRRNLLGQPLELIRLRPEYMRPATNQAGHLVGWLWESPSGARMTYDVDQIVHMRYPNPLHPIYGMGTVEAIIRSVNRHLSMDEHVVGFFDAGGSVNGVLTLKGTMPDAQFRRLKRQIREEYGAAAQSGLRVLILEEGNDFKPMSAPPRNLGVIEFAEMDKDEILSGFGVPAPILGGLMENANYKMEDAQHIFLRTMMPKSGRVGETISDGVVSRFGPWQLIMHPKASEPMSVRIDRGKAKLEAGGTLNEAREEWGGTLSDDPLADQVLVPSNLMPSGVAVVRKRPRVADPAANVRAALAWRSRLLERRGAQDLWAHDPASALQLDAGDPAPTDGLAAWGFEAMADIKVPDGFDADVVAAVREDHDTRLRQGVLILRPAMVDFFVGQRKRVLDRLDAFKRATLSERRKALTPAKLWNNAVENSALVGAYMAAADSFGEQAITGPALIAGTTIAWDAQQPHVAAVRERIGEKIKRVNDTTRQAVAKEVETGLSRGYSIPQIANGVADEGYRGILGVFDEATTVRAETIARSESAMVYNGASEAAYRQAGVEEVLVLDGTGDSVCADAAGSTWPLDRAAAEPIGHPNAVLHGTTVLPLGRVQCAYRAWWSGPVVRVRTARGAWLTIGPNHPVLTARGWLPAKRVRPGDQVVHGARQAGDAVGADDFEQVPARAEEIFDALSVVGVTGRVAVAPDQFHGDGNFCQGDVDVVRAASPLADVPHVPAVEQDAEGVFDGAGVQHPFFSGPSARLSRVDGVALAAAGRMGGSHVGGVAVAVPDGDTGAAQPVSDRAVANPEFLSELAARYALGVAGHDRGQVVAGPLAGRPPGHARSLQSPQDGGLADLESLGQLGHGGTLLVGLDQVLDVEADTFDGWAYDFQVEGRGYFADYRFCSNCVRAFAPKL